VTSVRPTVAVISHQASRTGAPIVLLRFIEWLRRANVADLRVAIDLGGPLEPAFQDLASTRVLAPDGRLSYLAMGEAALRRRGRHGAANTLRTLRQRRVRRWARRADIMYINSIVAADFVRCAPPGARVVLHVHELELGTRHGLVPGTEWHELDRRIDLYVAAADCVRKHLVDNLGVARDRVVVHKEFIDVDQVRAAPAPRDRADGPVVGACGTLEWRKGPDLFVQVAARVHTRRPDARFVWLGGSEQAAVDMVRDARVLGLGDRFDVLPPTDEPLPVLGSFDVLALTSREDPFPVVALEACALEVPVVTFADNGGMQELLTRETGRLVGYLDLDAMADEIVALLDDEEERKRVGAAAAALVAGKHDVDVVAPALWHDVVGGTSGRVRPEAAGPGRFDPVVSAPPPARRPPGRWVETKLSAVLFVALAALAARPPGAVGTAVLHVLTLMASLGLLGAYAHVVDDAFDVPADAAIGKPNAMARFTPRRRGAIALSLLALSAAPWLAIDLGPAATAAFLAIVGLPVFYAAPWFRWKEGMLGIVADTTLAQLAPAVVALAFVVHGIGLDPRRWIPLAVALGIWTSARGVRAIAVHQLADAASDAAAGNQTFVVSYGAPAGLALGLAAFIAELAGMAGLLALSWWLSPLLLAMIGVYLAAWAWARGRWTDVSFATVAVEGVRPALERFSRVWPPILVAAWLTAHDAGYAPLLVIAILLVRVSLSAELQTAARFALRLVLDVNEVGQRRMPFHAHSASRQNAVVISAEPQ
jgi:glycosyltransferase involved in cell wall biosynthesis